MKKNNIPSSEETILAQIVAYSLGSAVYKQQQRAAFLDAVNSVAPDTLVAILVKTSLAALVYYDLEKIQPRHRLCKSLLPFVLFHRMMNSRLAQCLRSLQPELEQHRIQPILLKGLANGHVCYPRPYLRKANDIDLIVNSEKQLLQCCAILLRRGYLNDDMDFAAKLRTDANYALNPFYKMTRLPVSAKYKWLQIAFETGYSEELLFREGKYFFVSTDIDLHKTLFLLHNATLPPLTAAQVMPSPFPGYRMLQRSAAIPYTAAKFMNDYLLISQGYPHNRGCLKILADFIRLVEHTGQKEFTRALEIAAHWSCEDLLLSLLALVQPLLPEMPIAGLPQPSASFRLPQVLQRILYKEPTRKR